MEGKEEIKNLKYGEQIKFNEERIVKSMITEQSFTIKKGDKAYVGKVGNSPAFCFISGAMASKQLILNEDEVKELNIKGYDYESIAKLILGRIKRRNEISEVFEDYEIEDEEITDEIGDVLMNILG